MTTQPDRDRLIDAWLDEGPRRFPAARLEGALRELHAAPRPRRPWLTHHRPELRLAARVALTAALVGGLVLGVSAVLPNGNSVTTLEAPAGWISTRPSGAPVFLEGDVPFAGTDWLLVGRADPDAPPDGPALVGVPATFQAWLQIADGGFRGSTGCTGTYGPWDEVPDGDRVTELRPFPIPLGIVACTEEQQAIDTQIQAQLENARSMQLARGGIEQLRPTIAAADLDPALAAHYADHPSLDRLVLFDADGRPSLIYAPVPAGTIDRQVIVQPDAPTLVGPLWGLAEWRQGVNLVGGPSSARAAAIRFHADGTFAGGSGCGPVSGTWGTPDASGAVVPGPITLVAEPITGCPETIDQAQSVLDQLPRVDMVAGVHITTTPLDFILPEERTTASTFALRHDTWYLALTGSGGQLLLAYVLMDELDDPSPAPSTGG
ncbi:MAG: hypothetical protein U0869_08730 [Chloroflexota bacterium]